MSEGCVAQFDQPYSLVREEAGILAQLVNEAGPAARDRLTDIARAAFREGPEGDTESEIQTRL